jgi:hypothetical protein
MSFFSAYAGTHRITIEHPDPEKTYWVELQKYLTRGATQKAESHLQKLTMVDGKPCPAPDVWSSQAEKVLASVLAWNFDDDSGMTAPINMQTIRRLPEVVFDQLLAAVEETNEPDAPAERRRFPDEGIVGDPDGDAGASELGDVPVEAGAVGAPWDAS